MLIPADVPHSIRLRGGAGLTLRAGERVEISIIKHVVGDKWAVGIRGHVLSARTDLELVPGQRLPAHVVSDGRQLVLRLGDPPRRSLDSLLAREGIPADEVSRNVATALMRSGLPLRRETVALLQSALTRMQARPALRQVSAARLARALAMLLDKGMDPSSPGSAELIEALEPRSGEDADRRGGRRDGDSRQRESATGDDAPSAENDAGAAAAVAGGAALTGSIATVLQRWAAAAAPEPAPAVAQQPSPLALFNHLSGAAAGAGREHWLAVPVALRQRRPGGALTDVVAGTVRLRRDRNGQLDRLVVDARATGTGLGLSFSIDTRAAAPRLTVIAEDAAAAEAATHRLPQLRQKVRNLGLQLDDIISEDKEFDGFGGSDEPVGYLAYRQIDTLG